MICPNCQRNIADSSDACPFCGQAILHATEISGGEVGERRSEEEPYERPLFRRFIYVSPSGPSPFSSPFPTGVITAALALLMGLTHGFLAFLGFLFFYIVFWLGSILLQAKAILKGYVIPDIALKCCLWALTWLIVSHLA